MIDQISLLNGSEQVEAVLTNEMPGACPIIEFRSRQENLDGGGYADTCRLTVPATHADAVHVADGNYVLYRDDDGNWQEYKLMLPERMDGAQSIIIAEGEHSFYELLGEWLDDIRPTDTSAALAVIQALAGTRWQLGTADDLGTASTRIYKTSVLAGLISIATAWKGELRFRLQVVGGEIVGRYVDILARRGRDTGKRFEIGKDLTQIKKSIDRSGLYTALVGRGKGVEIEQENGGNPAYGRRLEFTDIIWSTPINPADKPAGQNWIGDDAAAAAYGPGGRHIRGVVTFDDVTDPELLLQLTYDALQACKQPRVAYEMDALTLEGLANMAHEAVRFGDTVRVINGSVTPAITGEARIVIIDRNLIDPRDCQLTLGDYIPTVSNSLALLQQKLASMRDRQGAWDRAGSAISPYDGSSSTLQHKIDLLKTQLLSTVSGVSTDDNGNIIIENPAKTMALKLGAGIFAIANSRLEDGTYNWRTFGDGSGFTADLITAGTLSAAVVFAGALFGASGTFTSLIAGLLDAQRLHMGIDSFGDPFIKIYGSADPNNPSLIVTQYGLTFPNGADFQQYTSPSGNRTGIGIFAV